MNSQTANADARSRQIADLLVGAVDLHCHSGPAAMPRILDHHEAMLDAAAAKFRAVVYKDHYYLGTAHAILLEKLVPDTGVRLFSGIALNNASGGFNPHAVDHAIKLGGKIVWMPTLSAKNHIDVLASGAVKTFPKTAQKMLGPIPLSAFGPDGKLLDEVKQILGLIAEGDIILAGGISRRPSCSRCSSRRRLAVSGSCSSIIRPTRSSMPGSPMAYPSTAAPIEASEEHR